jgi:hypothetical protein
LEHEKNRADIEHKIKRHGYCSIEEKEFYAGYLEGLKRALEIIVPYEI